MANDASTSEPVLAEYRALLETERASLAAQLAELGYGYTGGLNYDSNFADPSQVTAERGEAEALAGELKEALVEVEAALGRVAQGTYGRCERCGQPISPARLEAKPAAPLCITCASRASLGERPISLVAGPGGLVAAGRPGPSPGRRCLLLPAGHHTRNPAAQRRPTDPTAPAPFVPTVDLGRDRRRCDPLALAGAPHRPHRRDLVLRDHPVDHPARDRARLGRLGVRGRHRQEGRAAHPQPDGPHR